jgi:ABC-type antimicrobial peptide transport system permease subunit
MTWSSSPNEIGVTSLGRSQKFCSWFAEAAILLAIGLGMGTALALALGSTAASLLYGLKATDPLTLGVAISAMTVVSLVASLLPAQRAATVQPMEALREE